MKNKITSIEKLKTIILKEKKKEKKIVLCHGTFDLLHIGHIKYFKEAKSLGEKLIVTVTSDRFVHKGPKRPAFNEKQRLEAISSLSFIDHVVLSDQKSAVEVIKNIKPNIYCKGADYKKHKNDITGEIVNEIKEVKKYGGNIHYTGAITFSSSKLINAYGDNQSKKQKNIINKIKKQYKISEIIDLIEKFKKIKVLVIGEIIIDEYNFCEGMGKSGKDSMLSLKDIRTEQYLGGAGAICRHLSEFCNQITLLTMVGEKGEFVNYIRKTLSKNIKFKYIKKKKSPTIVKKRFLDIISNNKLLGVYSINDDFLEDSEEKKFSTLLKKEILNHDLIIVSDYGHGMISSKSSKIISKSKKFLSLNAQINSTNVGLHSMRNYKNMNCVIINEGELRHEMRDKNNSIEKLMKKFSKEQKVKNLVVTRGKEGALLYSKTKFVECSAFAETTIDKIGSGDAMLSLISLFFKSGLTWELSLLAGSLAAAQSTETIGNKESVNKEKILKSLKHLLK